MIETIRKFVHDLNDFKVYQEGYQRLASNYTYTRKFEWESLKEAEWWTLSIFQPLWYHTITISVLYFVLIKVIQKWMENKKAYCLKMPLIMWNGTLAIFSIIGFVRFSEDFFYSISQDGVYRTLCYSVHPNDVAAFWCWLFCLSKFVELGDTLFIVLRKKPLIFLHYYHHAAVLIYTVHSGAEHTAAGRPFIVMNYLAHSVMYSYYTVTACGYRPPRWVAMTVTTVQTVQMLVGVFISLVVYNIKVTNDVPCQQSMANLYLAFTIYVTFAILFLHFFYNAYIARRPKAAKEHKKIE